MLKFHNKLIQYGLVYYQCSPFAGKPEYGYGTYNIPHIDYTDSRFILDDRGIYDVSINYHTNQ